MAPPREDDVNEANNHKFEKVGMIWERTCTDIICCIVFIVFIVGMLGISGFAISNGDPLNIIAPFDSVGNRCGFPLQGLERTPVNETDFSEYKYKHFTDLIAGTSNNPLVLYNAVCVKECPKKQAEYECMTNSDVESCTQSYYDT
jgi:solute carrier family 44 (choline transporter-like protein), member 2/4/5